MSRKLATQASSNIISEDIITKICEKQADKILEKMEERLDKMEENLNIFLNNVDQNSKKIEVLERKLDISEQYNRLNNLRVYGVEEHDNENTEEVLLKLFKNKMKITISTGDIERAFRMGAHKDNMHRPIFVRFLSYKTRTAIFNEKKALKKTGFVIREDLTGERIKLLKNAISKYGKTNVWTSGGKVFVMHNNQKQLIQSALDI